MPDVLWFKAVAKSLVLPPTSLLLLAALGLLIIRRAPRAGRWLASAAIGLLVLLSMPVVANALLRWVDDSPPLDLAAARSAQAVVILGGGTRRNAAEYGGDTLGRLTLERVRYGARVARETGLPVMVTGGAVLGGETEAKLMRAALNDEFGIAVRWAEDRSRTTRENAALSAPILRAAGVNRVVLVVHSVDLPRASAEFASQGIGVVPAPTGIPSKGGPGILDFVPGIAGLQASYLAFYEILANAVRWASGR